MAWHVGSRLLPTFDDGCLVISHQIWPHERSSHRFVTWQKKLCWTFGTNHSEIGPSGTSWQDRLCWLLHIPTEKPNLLPQQLAKETSSSLGLTQIYGAHQMKIQGMVASRKLPDQAWSSYQILSAVGSNMHFLRQLWCTFAQEFANCKGSCSSLLCTQILSSSPSSKAVRLFKSYAWLQVLLSKCLIYLSFKSL